MDIERVDEYYFIGPSWMDFVEEANIKEGDLVIFRQFINSMDVPVCIFKEEDVSGKWVARGKAIQYFFFWDN